MDAAWYLNRELSWLDFNARVLALADDANVPLLERAKFLAIFSQNLDEFFQVRVAGLKDQVAASVATTSPDGRTPAQQLLDIRDQVDVLNARALDIFLDAIVPGLRENGIVFSSWDELDDDDRKHLDEVFEERIFPVLTPLAVDPGHPFPYISDLSLNLAVIVRDPVTQARRFARVKVPLLLPRFVVIPDGERFVALEQVIAAHLDTLFPGMDIEGHFPFRVTRNADLTLEDEEADDLLAAVEFELRRRRFGRAVRLEVDESMTDEIRELLERELDVEDDDVYQHVGPIDLGGLWSVHGVDRPDLKDPVWVPDHPGPAGHRRRRAGQLLPGAAPGRRAGAPPLLVVRHLGRGVHPPGLGRSQGAGHQADPLPHVGRQLDHQVADPGGRAGQAGGRAGRAQGPLRRGEQHRVGPRAGEGGRARGLRPGRPEDPHQDHARGARGAGRHAPLLPRRHRQLQPQDGPALRGRRPAHLRPRHRRPTSPSCSTSSPATPATSSTASCSWRRTTCAPARPR